MASETDRASAVRDEPRAWSALMARAQSGDAAAYRLLLLAVAPYLRALAARVQRNPSDAEDAVQDILLTLHAVRHTYDPSRPFAPWLAGIARHRLADRLRRQGRRGSVEIALAPKHEEVMSEEPRDEADILGAQVLLAALATLPSGQRQALTLLKLKEMSLKEAAAVTGLSVAALKIASHRGIKSLRRLLGGRGERA